MVAAAPLADDAAAAAWLSGRPARAPTAIRRGRARACSTGRVHAHRVAAADPTSPGPTRGTALVTRVGFGSGEQVAEGRWAAARELPPPARAAARDGARCARRSASPRCSPAATPRWPASSWRCAPASTSTHGRPREAALQLAIALAAAVEELEAGASWPAWPARLEELAGRRAAVARRGRRGAQGGLDGAAPRRSRAALARLEAALRARAAGASDKGSSEAGGAHRGPRAPPSSSATTSPFELEPRRLASYGVAPHGDQRDPLRRRQA